MDNITYFYLPGIYSFYKLNIMMIDFIKENPEKCIENLRIGAVYGCFPQNIWNGGRIYVGEKASEDIVKQVVEAYNRRGVAVRFTWTNSLLEEQHLNDKECLTVMDIANNGINEVLVNTEILEEMIREKYPNYKLISSTTKCILSVDEFNKELEKDYKLVVLDYRKNHDLKFIFDINDLSRVEMLINAWCSPMCPNRQEHYKALSKATLEGAPSCPFMCKTKAKNFYQSFQNHSTLHVNEIPVYKEMGIHHFKLEGRSYDVPNVLETYLYYLVKPEFHNEVRLAFLSKLFPWNHIPYQPM